MRKPDKPLDVQKIIRKAVGLILQEDQEHKVKAILLFGSQADSTAMWRSDIDICVVFKADLSLREATLFRIHILGELPDVVDLQVFNILPLKIKKTIADNHKILFQTEEFNEESFIKSHQDLFFELKRRLASIEA